MPRPDSSAVPIASWMQLEQTIERLHDAARAGLSVREFYCRLLAEGRTAIGALGGSVWRLPAGSSAELICELWPEQRTHSAGFVASRRQALQRVVDSGEPEILAVNSSSRSNDNADAAEALLCPVSSTIADVSRPGNAATFVLEFWFPSGGDRLTQQAWIDFAVTLADVAADFQARHELRQLRDTAELHRQALSLLVRVQQPRDLTGAAFELANEGRRVLGCDRLSVVIRRGCRWRLLSPSGAARIQRRNDFTRRTERLADSVARWGEPIHYPAASSGEGELPARLAAALEDQVDHSHARELTCVPLAFRSPSTSGGTKRQRFDVVLLAENFEEHIGTIWRQQVSELGELCAPALARAMALDRFPIRTVLALSDRLAVLTQPRRFLRALLIMTALAAAISSLVLIPAEFNVEAPATLSTVIERDIFATATGSVAEVRVQHGQMVQRGDVLVVLNDPELSLKLQQVSGEIDATRKRLDALALTRTDRTLRENQAVDRLPLAAEQRQLEERLISLKSQQQLLQSRREALTLRSPLTGQVLTQDVQGLLSSRPVERGQVLLTVADTASGWQLIADVPQRQIGHLLNAQREQDAAPTASYRLAGDVSTTYAAHIEEVSVAAPLEADGLEDQTAPVKVRIALDSPPPAAARPGMTATVQIHCGQRPLGYVWLYDVGATLYRWVTF